MESTTIEQLKQTLAFKLFSELKSKNIGPTLALTKALNDDDITKELIPGQLNLIRKIVYYGYAPTAYMTVTEQDKFEEELATQDYFTCFRFLLAHNGLRKGSIHVLLGAAGKGKSSLIRSIVIENSIHKNVFILLSEEQPNAYALKLNQTASSMKHLSKVNSDSLSRIKFATELSQIHDSKKNFEEFFQMIRDFIKKDEIDLFIYDNFSTGLLSEEFENQKLAIRRFKEIASDFNIPILIALHPTKGAATYNLFLTNENVRGNSALATMPEYLYTLNSCEIEGQIRNFLYIDKARYFDKAQGLWFELQYEKKEGLGGFYKSDIQINKSGALEALKKARKS